MAENYQDAYGNYVSLEKLVRMEPDWACSRIRAERARVAELEAQVAAVEEWTHRMGVELRPSGPDTYGEGVRDSKAKVARLLARTAPKDAKP